MKTLLSADKRRLIADRARRNEAAHAEQRAQEWAQAVEAARRGWNARSAWAGSTPNLAIDQERRRLCVKPCAGNGQRPLVQHGQAVRYLGIGGGGMGYGAPATVGAGLA
jgi:hypothetical protein